MPGGITCTLDGAVLWRLALAPRVPVLVAPADPERSAGYGSVAELPQQLGAGLQGMVESGMAPDPAAVAAAIIAVIAGPSAPCEPSSPAPTATTSPPSTPPPPPPRPPCFSASG